MAVVGSTAVVAVRDLNGTEAVTIAIGGTESR